MLKLSIIEATHPAELNFQPHIRDWFNAVGVDPAGMQLTRFTQTEPAMQMVADGLGVKLCQNMLADKYLESGDLIIPFNIAIRREGFRFRVVCRRGEEEREPIRSIRGFFPQEMAAVSSRNQQVKVLVLPRIE